MIERKSVSLKMGGVGGVGGKVRSKSKIQMSRSEAPRHMMLALQRNP